MVSTNLCSHQNGSAVGRNPSRSLSLSQVGDKWAANPVAKSHNRNIWRDVFSAYPNGKKALVYLCVNVGRCWCFINLSPTISGLMYKMPALTHAYRHQISACAAAAHPVRATPSTTRRARNHLTHRNHCLLLFIIPSLQYSDWLNFKLILMRILRNIFFVFAISRAIHATGCLFPLLVYCGCTCENQ